MNNRDTILAAIKEAQPALKPIPVLDYSVVAKNGNLADSFEQFVLAVGGVVQRLHDMQQLEDEIVTMRSAGHFIANRLEEIAALDELPGSKEALEKLQRAYIRGRLGVAENGAIWVEESAMGNRLLPFICQELVLVIKKEELVATMHDAYQYIQINKNGFGVFIAGPSKTADIEQSLVIGAHGPVALRVVLLTHG
ncbi:LUD domain-containing protein [Flavihumibacter sp. CACIAM 22H1]|uniref:LutC/YkgG family protein n=1 Tax=Flavihumibacter sp. CACIAM 22H1 TaxID=1812911 RepID=UPI0007A80D9A|nr:LUD domain-containing protein [Flavihumibacter sp. CACIAM 22H1]KYP15426.1 MAG: hypothetical protein A1D16_12955 [Flavihumibacter sp. CACIAM 22H1]